MSTSAHKPVLQDLALAQLAELVAQLGLPAFHARQLYHWLHRRGELAPAAMTDLPGDLRAYLTQHYTCQPLALAATARSSDGSVKYAWSTPQGAPVEAVLMPRYDRATALCVSCQSGCALRCGFCQTGRLGLREQLSAGLMLAQLYQAEQLSGAQVERVVFMGMGEPLLNIGPVRRAVETLSGAEGRGWSPRRITVSTVGLAKPLVEMARTFPRINLALSLHFTTAGQRAEHMPGAEQEPGKLLEALHYYRRVNGGKITLEYALMAGLNDGDADARRLLRCARLAGLDQESDLILEAEEWPLPKRVQSLPLHVNLIAYNPIPAAPQYRPSPERRVDEFARQLRDAGVPVTVRHSRGADIAAACGQLGSDTLGVG